eukprot:Rmarinus@m.7653
MSLSPTTDRSSPADRARTVANKLLKSVAAVSTKISQGVQKLSDNLFEFPEHVPVPDDKKCIERVVVWKGSGKSDMLEHYENAWAHLDYNASILYKGGEVVDYNVIKVCNSCLQNIGAYQQFSESLLTFPELLSSVSTMKYNLEKLTENILALEKSLDEHAAVYYDKRVSQFKRDCSDELERYEAQHREKLFELDAQLRREKAEVALRAEAEQVTRNAIAAGLPDDSSISLAESLVLSETAITQRIANDLHSEAEEGRGSSSPGVGHAAAVAEAAAELNDSPLDDFYDEDEGSGAERSPTLKASNLAPES